MDLSPGHLITTGTTHRPGAAHQRAPGCHAARWRHRGGRRPPARTP